MRPSVSFILIRINIIAGQGHRFLVARKLHLENDLAAVPESMLACLQVITPHPNKVGIVKRLDFGLVGHKPIIPMSQCFCVVIAPDFNVSQTQVRSLEIGGDLTQ